MPLRDRSAGPGSVGRAAGWFPVVGLLLGAILVAAWWLAGAIFPRSPAAAIVVAAWTVLTGGLHLDGVADCCDGLLGPHTRERRLEILDDPRTGAFGVIGIVLLVMLKTAAVAVLDHPGPLVIAPVLGRLTILYLAVMPPARASGMAWEFHRGLSRQGLCVATLTAAMAAGVLVSQGLLSYLLAVLVALFLGRVAFRRLGGVTGDVLGLGCELTEVLLLLLGVSRLA